VGPPTLERRVVAEQVLETAARLERAIQSPPPVPVTGTATLVLVREDGSEEVVSKERFVIGRGRHCDLVIDSGKVSREHAALSRENGGWFIEDLGSSNGTWFQRERIDRRRIEDGDEYYVCSERIRFALR
jgi:pSer/pThr/pTyr-binding forkhead associated (FHA) protein